MKLFTLSLAPIVAVAVGIEAESLGLDLGTALLFWSFPVAVSVLVALNTWGPHESGAARLGARPWARRWFGPWVTFGSLWENKPEDDGGGGWLAGLALLIGLGVIAAWLPTGIVLKLRAYGGGNAALGATIVIVTGYVLLWADAQLARIEAGDPPLLRLSTLPVLLVLAVVLWELRPLWHGVAMLSVQYPLATWIPLLAGAAVAVLNRGRIKRLRRATIFGICGLALMLVPALEASRLYAATAYEGCVAAPARLAAAAVVEAGRRGPRRRT